MSAAYKRIAELLDRWQASVDLHTRYLALDDASYAKAQPWPKHQRPTKWVIEIARTRIAEIRRELALREEAGDPTFAETLELMSLLTNLLGSEHIERFIPLATPQPNTSASGTVRRPRLKQAPDKSPTDRTVVQAPRGNPARSAPQRAAAPAPTKPAAAAPPKSAPAPARPAAAAPAAKGAVVPNAMIATVVADAVRFLSWGREWPALAPSIARLADRPPEAEIVKILRANRALIEQKSRHPAD